MGDEIEHRVCSHCKKPKPVGEFGVHKELALDGGLLRNLYCNSCNVNFPEDVHDPYTMDTSVD